MRHDDYIQLKRKKERKSFERVMDLGKTHISMISDGGRISIAYNMKRFEYKKLCSQNNPRVEVRISVKI